MIDTSDILSRIKHLPMYKYVNYSYVEGILNALKIISVVSIFALISMIASMILGLRKKDCVAVLVVNIMVKTVMVFLCQIIWKLVLLYDTYIYIALLILTIIIEGFIYKKVLKNKKHSGMKVSIICNVCLAIIIMLTDIIFVYGFRWMLNF